MDRANCSFETSFQSWLIRQQKYLHQLISTLNNSQDKLESELKTLVSQVLSHYLQYYVAKSEAARENVFIMFAPPWFSSFEHTFLWVSGFKPGLAFKILRNTVNQNELSDTQVENLHRLEAEIRAAERDLNDKMASIQESCAMPPLVDLARRTILGGGRFDGEIRGDIDATMERLSARMEAIVEDADFIRMETTRKIIEILSPLQGLRFLAAATKLQLKIHRLGQQIESQRISS